MGGRGRGVVRLEDIGCQRTRSGAVNHRRTATPTGAASAATGPVAHGEFGEGQVPGTDAEVPNDVDVDHAAMARARTVGAQRLWI